MNHSSTAAPADSLRPAGSSVFRRGPAVVVLALTLASALVLVPALPAAATWSIIAVDPETGEVGAAMAACSAVSALGEPDEVPAPLVLVPGGGAAVAQGSVDPGDLLQLRAALTDSIGIESVTDSEADAERIIAIVGADNEPELQTVRQYAVVIGDAVASFDGGETSPVAAMARGSGVAAQGVAVVSEAVVVDARAAYVVARAEGASLADALVAALEAGSRAGGDRRCGEQTALFAHVSVVSEGESGITPSRLLTVTVDEGDGGNPVLLLARAHEEGRTGWIDAGRRSPTTIPRWLVLAAGMLMVVASVAVIRYGMGHRRRPVG